MNDATLDVVIVNGGGRGGTSKALLTKQGKTDEKTASFCQCRRRRRQRHSATQTPLAAAGWQQLSDGGSCGGGLDGSGRAFCPSVCTMNAHCFHHHHSHHHPHGDKHMVAGAAGLAELTSHCHITHCHQFSPSGHAKKVKTHNQRRQQQEHTSSKSSSHCTNRRHHKRRAYEQRNHAQQHNNQQVSPSHVKKHQQKSSFDSSVEQLCQQQSQPELCQEIAIEIDAATMTEDNGSTATSNFAFKITNEQVNEKVKEDGRRSNSYEQKLTPFDGRRSSFNSNTTIETDELSNDDDDDGNDQDIEDNADEQGEGDELTPRRDENNCSITPRTICCELDDIANGSIEPLTGEGTAYCPYGMPLPRDLRNERVRIKRKSYDADPIDYCSSCSSCSCARCDDNTSSCSSLDDDDGPHANGGSPHEFTVSAECHRCNLPRQSSSASTMGEADDEEEEQQQLESNKFVSVRSTEPPSSSQHTSRRSSESFCSCNSNSCYHCSCSCDECDTTGRMRTAREAISNATTLPNEMDEQHSSTLTPLTNNSSVVTTPLGDDAQADLTIRSGTSNIFNSAMDSGGADDASSLSQSAEYFSMSSSNHPSRSTPTITPVHKPKTTTTGSVNVGTNNNNSTQQPSIKQCKHYSKHHRHKHTDTAQDGYL